MGRGCPHGSHHCRQPHIILLQLGEPEWGAPCLQPIRGAMWEEGCSLVALISLHLPYPHRGPRSEAQEDWCVTEAGCTTSPGQGRGSDTDSPPGWGSRFSVSCGLMRGMRRGNQGPQDRDS